MSEFMKIASWTNHVNGVVDDPRKFARVLNDLQDVTLQDVVASLGFDNKAYLCVKEISVPVKLDMSRSIRSISRQWSSAFKVQLIRKYQQGDPSVVFYRSLYAAHIACAEGILTNNTSELWAWQQSGVFCSSNASHETPQSLIEQWSTTSIERGYHQIALWRYLLQSPLLLSALQRLEERHWRKHLVGLAKALGLNPEPVVDFLKLNFRAAKSLPGARLKSFSVSSQQAAQRVTNHLPKLMKTHAFLNAIQKSNSAQCRSLMCLAIVVSEPALVTFPKVDRERRLLEISSEIERSIYSKPAAFDTGELELDESAVSTELRSPDTSLSWGNADESAFANSVPTFATEVAEAPIDSFVEPVFEQVDPVVTPFGGLFWLYNILLAHPEMVQNLLSHSVFETLDHRWVWCWLACHLLSEPCSELPIDASIRTVVIAFAGIVDATEFDELISREPNNRQQTVLREVADDIKVKFLDKIQQSNPGSDISYVAVLRRNARIQHDGPWLEIEFSLNDVDINVRRAGLDADPGFIQWLGTVVRFSYA